MTTPTLPVIPFSIGFHYFCDHRCWRCELSPVCPVFHRWSKLGRKRQKAIRSPAARVASVMAISVQITVEDAAILAAEIKRTMPQESQMLDGMRRLSAGTPLEEPGPVVQRDPLVTRGAEYAQNCWPALQALRPILAARGDQAAVDAAERLEETCATIASKIFRAISSAFNAGTDADDVQSDANGSAKVALLLIEESRQAWRVLMQPGRAVADGLPARFVSMLDALEAGLMQRYPRAFEFIRPGFDTGLASVNNAQVAEALKKAAAGSN